MNSVERAVLTPQQELERDTYIAERHIERSKHRGDAAWRVAEQITGLGDYTPADEGEPPHGAKW